MEKNNYNINLNPEELSSEDIHKHQDFDALLNQFNALDTQPEQPKAIEATSKIRPLWKVALAAAAVMAGLFFYTNIRSTGTSSDLPALFADQPYVNPPIEQAQAQFASYKVDAYKGGTYEYKSGSKIVIPPRAFVDRSGNFAIGEVDIKYKEYHDFVDFFMSGIPMEYDSSGVRYILESAGMIEVYAEQDGERLDMAPEKAIEIELISEINLSDPNNPPAYNIYRLDEKKRNWVYQTDDQIEVLEKVPSASELLTENPTEASFASELQEEMTNIEADRRRRLTAIEATIPAPQRPIRPTRANENNFSFDLDINNGAAAISPSEEHAAVNEAQNEIAALQQQYEGIIWEVMANQPQFNESTSETVWDDFKLRKVGSQNYTLTLIEGSRQVVVKVKPVLMGNDYDNAIASFEAELAQYNAQMQERDAQLADKKAALAEATRVAQETANQAYEDKVAALRHAGQGHRATDEMMKHKILNRFAVSSFGVWNCDRPLPPYIYALNAEVQDQFNKKYKGNIAYFVDKKRNTVNRFHVDNKTIVSFDKTADNLMWVVTGDNKLAVYRPEDFKKINYESQTKEHTFVMNLIDQEINTEEDARKILDF